MRHDAHWRGSPRATTKREFMRLVEILSPSKHDVFYDLGCGYAGPCIWIAPMVRKSIGIEDHYYRYLRAKEEVKKSGLTNIEIHRHDIAKASYREATIAYSVLSIGPDILGKIQRQAKKGARIVLYSFPPFPIKSEKLFAGGYYLITTPLERVADEDEYARLSLGRKRVTIKDLFKTMDKVEVRILKREIKQADSIWRRLTRGAL
jgi:hypothetical protein